MYSVTKEFKFDAAHRLVNGYVGKCAHIHGHEWRVRLTLTGTKLDEFGFVVDFGDLKWLRDYIDEHLDHACLVAVTDFHLVAWLAEHEQRREIFPFNPTSENLCKFLFDLCHDHYRYHETVFVRSVEVDETCTSSARYGQ